MSFAESDQSPAFVKLLIPYLGQRGGFPQTKFKGLVLHPFYEQTKDAEERVEAHVGGRGPTYVRVGVGSKAGKIDQGVALNAMPDIFGLIAG